jgi:hypothetical protein
MVTGLKEIYSLRDPKIAKELADDANAIAKAKDKKKAVEEFKLKHAANLQYLIDPEHPDFGPKNNQMVYLWGRKKGGRSDFSGRFFGDYFGTVNTHGHTTVCQGSLYFTCKAMSEQYEYNKFSGGQKFYWQEILRERRSISSAWVQSLRCQLRPPNREFKARSEYARRGKAKMTVVDPVSTKRQQRLITTFLSFLERMELSLRGLSSGSSRIKHMMPNTSPMRINQRQKQPTRPRGRMPPFS